MKEKTPLLLEEEKLRQEKVVALWNTNVAKMHFQQNICHQLRSWAFGITGGMLTLMYNIEQCSYQIRLMLHIFLFLIILLILHKDLSWHRYFWKYHARAKNCEKALAGIEDYQFDYWMGDKSESRMKLFVDHGIKKIFTANTDFVELYLLLMVATSFIFSIYL